MSESKPAPPELSPADKAAALFANLVLQQTNMAWMCLGKVASPEAGQPTVDLESAELLIDQLEMLKTKTKGNLDPREEHLLQQSLTSLRLAFVEAVEAAAKSPPPAPAPAPAAAPSSSSTAESAPAAKADEGRVKFSKKY